MLSNMLTRGLASNTSRSFSTKVLRTPMSNQSNLKMVTSLAGLGLGWATISRLNFGNLCGRVKRAQCEYEQIQADEDDVPKDMMSLMINGFTQRERVALKNKNTCLIGAVLGHVIPGANCLVWWYNVESQYTYDAWWKKFGLLALGVKGVVATSILAGIYFT